MLAVLVYFGCFLHSASFAAATDPPVTAYLSSASKSTKIDVVISSVRFNLIANMIDS